MKKLYLILITSILFASCKKDDDTKQVSLIPETFDNVLITNSNDTSTTQILYDSEFRIKTIKQLYEYHNGNQSTIYYSSTGTIDSVVKYYVRFDGEIIYDDKSVYSLEYDDLKRVTSIKNETNNSTLLTVNYIGNRLIVPGVTDITYDSVNNSIVYPFPNYRTLQYDSDPAYKSLFGKFTDGIFLYMMRVDDSNGHKSFLLPFAVYDKKPQGYSYQLRYSGYPNKISNQDITITFEYNK